MWSTSIMALHGMLLIKNEYCNFCKYLVGYSTTQSLIQNRYLTLATTVVVTSSIDDKIKEIGELLVSIQLLRRNKARKKLVDDILNQIPNNNSNLHLFAFN